MNVSAAEIDEAASVLRRGGVVCVPTETFYGLAVDIGSADGLAALVAIKGREPRAPFALIAANAEQARSVARAWPAVAGELGRRFWPGPLTIVVPAAPGLPAELVGPGGGVGVRVSSHPVPVALAHALGRPITATSANPSGLPPARDVAEARAYFGDSVAYLDAGRAPGEQASTIVAVDARGVVTVLRPGPISLPADLGS